MRLGLFHWAEYQGGPGALCINTYLRPQLQNWTLNMYTTPRRQQPRRPLSYKSVVNQTPIAFLILSEKFCDSNCSILIVVVVIVKYIRIIQPRAVPA